MLTGFRDKKFQELIIIEGGTISETISKKTNYLIIKENFMTDNENVIIFDEDDDEDRVNGWVFYHQYTLVDIKKNYI